MNCPRCHGLLEQGALFCKYCGAKFQYTSKPAVDINRGHTIAGGSIDYFNKAFNILAVMLIIGVVLPILQPNYGFYGRDNVDVVFYNFKLLGEPGVNFFIKLGAIYPLLAGIAILIINSQQNGMKLFTKNLVIMLISIFPFVFLLTQNNMIRQLGSNQYLSNLITSSILGVIGMLLLLSTGLALKSNRFSLIVKILGTVAASAYFISLLIPVDNYLPMEISINFLSSEQNSPGALINIIGLVTLTSTGLIIAASIYAYMTWNIKYLNKRTGEIITKLWIGSQIAILTGFIYVLIVSISESNSGAEIGLLFLVIIKLIIIIYSLFLLASISIANFVTKLPENNALTVRSTPSPEHIFRSADATVIENRILKLKEMFQRGLINEEEYLAKKKEYLTML